LLGDICSNSHVSKQVLSLPTFVLARARPLVFPLFRWIFVASCRSAEKSACFSEMLFPTFLKPPVLILMTHRVPQLSLLSPALQQHFPVWCSLRESSLVVPNIPLEQARSCLVRQAVSPMLFGQAMALYQNIHVL